MSNEKGLSAECIACDRAGSHGKHGSASMLMAWRSAPPNACRKCELGEQLEVERRTFSKICDRSRERNRLPLARLRSPICDAPFPVRRPAVPQRLTLTFYANAHTP